MRMGIFLLSSESAYVAQISGQNARNEQEAEQEGAQNNTPPSITAANATEKGFRNTPDRNRRC